MDEESLRYQVASLEEVTLSNVISEAGQKAKRGTIRAVSGIKQLFDKSKIIEPDVISIEEKIKIKKKQLELKKKDELLDIIKKDLRDKVNAAGGNVNINCSDDELSVCVIEIAIKGFKKEIKQNLTYAQKADAICHRYNERLISQVKEKLNNETQEERKKTDEAINEKLAQMTDKQQKELKEALGIQKLTSEMIRKMLTTTAGTTATMVALDASGFGVYIALTTIMHAIFTTTLGITLPFAAYTAGTTALSFITGPFGWFVFAGVQVIMLNNSKKKLIYELLAQIVWVGVEYYGKLFTPKEEELPSWLPSIERDVAIKNQEELLKFIQENENLKANQKTLLDEIKHKEDGIRECQESIKLYTKELKSANFKISEFNSLNMKLNKEFIKLQQEYEKQNEQVQKFEKTSNEIPEEQKKKWDEIRQKYEKTKQELEIKRKEIEDLYQYVGKLDEDIGKKKKEINSLQVEVSYQTEKIQDLNSKLDKSNEIVNIRSEKEERNIAKRWEIAYTHFKFESGVIKSVIKNYEYNELGYIERALMELHEAKDPYAIQSNREKMHSGGVHLEFSTYSGFPSRIFYSLIKNASDGKTVCITNISKHNDSRYGKRIS